MSAYPGPTEPLFEQLHEHLEALNRDFDSVITQAAALKLERDQMRERLADLVPIVQALVEFCDAELPEALSSRMPVDRARAWLLEVLR
jgi:regulator of replication initiation timing